MIELFLQHIIEVRKKMQNRLKERNKEHELISAIAYTQELQKKIQENSSRLDAAYKKGLISYPQYAHLQKTVFQGRKINDWLQYYNSCISY